MASVIIGPEFFKKEFNEYDNWRWAWVREICQNSIDAGSAQITFETEEINGNTHVTVVNDGDPMTEDILINKLLALGASGKNFEGTTGGFGKAKLILLFCHESWEVTSGATRVSGIGGEYETEVVPYFDGTRTHVVMKGHHKSEIDDAILLFIAVAQWSGTFVINGVTMKADLRKGTPRRDLGFGKVYTNKQFTYRMIVRINGVPMFITRTGFDRCVIVELKGASDEVLTSNRDGLVSPFRNELSDFITELSVDKRSALKDRNRGPRYTQYRGTKLCHSQAINVAAIVHSELPDEKRVEYPGGPVISNVETVFMSDGVISGVDVGGDAEVHAPVMHDAGTNHWGGRAAAYAGVSSVPVPRRQVATLGTSFVIKNETDLKVPPYYDPGSGEFSVYSGKLVRIWGRIMLEMHRLFDREAEFSIGFIFDDSTEAEFEQGDYGLVYYLNPCKIIEQDSSRSKSFKKRFKLTDRDKLIMIGLHEFIHCLGYGWHDERYSCKFTDLAGVVLKERRRFNWCFK